MAKKKRRQNSDDVESATSRALAVYEFRDQHVVLDEDVAAIFGVETKRLNEQVRRNAQKFGDDFAFRLTDEEFDDLKSQIATSNGKWGGRRYSPQVFSEHGVVMAATILRSTKAIEATRFVVKTFVEARRNARKQLITEDHGQLEPLKSGQKTNQLSDKLNATLTHVLDAIVDPEEERTVKEEAGAIVAEATKSIKAYLKKAGHENERTAAEVHRILAEAESIKVDTERKRTEIQHRQLALRAKQLRLLIQAQRYTETESVDGLLAVLSDLEKS